MLSCRNPLSGLMTISQLVQAQHLPLEMLLNLFWSRPLFPSWQVIGPAGPSQELYPLITRLWSRIPEATVNTMCAKPLSYHLLLQARKCNFSLWSQGSLRHCTRRQQCTCFGEYCWRQCLRLCLGHLVECGRCWKVLTVMIVEVVR